MISIYQEVTYLLNILKKGPRAWLVTGAPHILRPALDHGLAERHTVSSKQCQAQAQGQAQGQATKPIKPRMYLPLSQKVRLVVAPSGGNG